MASQCTMVQNTDFWGADIAKKEGVASAAACCAVCMKHDACFRWTYSKRTQRCFLKREVGWTRRAIEDKVSGKVMRGTTPSPSPSPLSRVPPSPSNLAPIPSSGKFYKQNYADVLGLNWWFFEAQRSGKLPPNGYRIPWRRSAHITDIVPGGWYDAGDYLKLNFPLASVVSYLAWGIIEFKDGYNSAGQMQYALDNLYAAADYLKQSHVAPKKYIGQIGNPEVDHAFWGRPEEQKTARPAYVYDSTMGASDLLGKVAAALASCAIVWREIDSGIAADFLKHAKQLWQWGGEKKGKYSDYYKAATASIYASSDWEDDMAWGAAWLYRATGDRSYLTSAVEYYKKKDWDVTADWDNSGAAVAVLLANLIQDGVDVPSAKDINSFVVDDFLRAWIKSDGYLEIVKTPKGMSRPKWSKWGNLQLSTTAAFMALSYAKHSSSSSLRASAVQWARSQVDYAMGSSGRSYVVGYGINPPLRPHHAGASCPDVPARCDWANFNSDKPNPQILYGALVAGPAGPGDNSYNDKRSDYVTNEVSTEYNSGFAGALAGLIELV